MTEQQAIDLKMALLKVENAKEKAQQAVRCAQAAVDYVIDCHMLLIRISDAEQAQQ